MGRLPLGIYIELISRRPQPEWYVLRLDIQTLKYIQLILKHGKYKEHSLPDGRESFNVWFSVARTFSNISRSSLILEGAVVPCISAAMNGTSSGSRVGYLSVTDIIATRQDSLQHTSTRASRPRGSAAHGTGDLYSFSFTECVLGVRCSGVCSSASGSAMRPRARLRSASSFIRLKLASSSHTNGLSLMNR